ncbi:unnamed protein product, partial [Effrenium voratum]
MQRALLKSSSRVVQSGFEMAELENDMCPSPLCAKFSATSAGPVREELLTASPADVECADVELTDETGDVSAENASAEENDADDAAADADASAATDAEGFPAGARGRRRRKRAVRGEARRARSMPQRGRKEEKEEEIEEKEKKKKTFRPSLLLKIRPTNLEDAMARFFDSDFSEAPKFEYAFSDEVVNKAFEENSSVCFEHLGAAKRIIDKVHSAYGGPDAFMQRMYGEEKAPCEELRQMVADYLKEHNVDDKVEIRLVEGMLSAANVATIGEGRYAVNIANGPVSKPILQSICDHEVGTHLLRMMNDEHQVWHGCRDRYKLTNPWITEEGFATLNTYLSLPCKLLYTQAVRYWAVCRGAQVGFVELFRELRQQVSDVKRCWQICCRVKRGMLDTSLPGAFYMDQ